MKKSIYPILLFIILELLIITAITLWIVWYVLERSDYEGILTLAQQAYSHLEFNESGHAKMIWGILLLSFTLIASTLTFVEWLKAKIAIKNGITFVSAFTHELMTPLTCIQMNLETLCQQGNLQEDKKLCLLKAAFAESKRLQNSIDKILHIKKIENKRNLLKLGQLPAKQFFDQYFHNAQVEFPRVKIVFISDITSAANVILDEIAFSIALNNLIENAQKYCPHNRPELNVWISQLKQKLMIKIQDNGRGIDKRKLRKIFRLFYRENENIRGAGLGLYIVKNIIKWHNGKIWAESLGINHGTTFTIIIPLARR